MKLSEYAAERGITYRTAWERFRLGKIPGAFKDDTGHVVVPNPAEARRGVAAVYARVSSHPQRADLDRQADRLAAYATARGLQVVTVVKEIASGVDDDRPKLTRLLKDPRWGTLVVEHRDRLTRVGFGWFETFLGMQGRVIDVASPAQEHTADLMDDFLAIIYSFAVRLYGLRGFKARSRRLVAALEREAAADTAGGVGPGGYGDRHG